MEMAVERKRAGGIDAPPWWLKMATEKRREIGTSVEELAAAVSAAMEAPVDQSRISKCLNGTTSTIPLLEVISAILAIPAPVFIASDPVEARELESVRAVAARRAKLLAKADAKIAAAKADATKLADSQRGRVGSKDVGEAGRAGRGVARSRRDPREN